MVEFIDSIVTVLPFFVIFVFEFVPIAGDKVSTNDSEGQNQNTSSLLNVEGELERSLQRLDTRSYELLDPDKLDYVIHGELRTRTEIEPDEFEELMCNVPTSVQTQVPVSEVDMARIAKHHVSYIYDKTQAIVGGSATIISFGVVLYSRASGRPIPLVDLLIYMAGPAVILIFCTILYLYLFVGSPLEYRSVKDDLGFSPVSLVILVTNFGICVGILALDGLIIGY